MSELVERLRKPLSAGMFLNIAELITVLEVQRKEAADEIERLQAELREARDVMRRVQSLNNAIRDDEGYHWAHASVIDEEITAFLAK